MHMGHKIHLSAALGLMLVVVAPLEEITVKNKGKIVPIFGTRRGPTFDNASGLCHFQNFVQRGPGKEGIGKHYKSMSHLFILTSIVYGPYHGGEE